MRSDLDTRLADVASQPATPQSVTLLAAVDPAELDAGAKVNYLKASQRAVAWLEGLQQHALAVIEAAAGRTPLTPQQLEDDWAREQVGTALRLHPNTAARRLFIARALTDRFQATQRALEQGRINYLQAMLIVDGAVPLREELHPEYERRVLTKAERQTVGDTGRSIKKVVAQLDPKDAEQAHQAAYAERRVQMWPGDDAMAEVQAVLGADGAQIVMTALNGLVDAVRAATPDDPRTNAQIRADLFCEVFDAIRTGGAMPSPYFAPEPDDNTEDDDSGSDDTGGDGPGGGDPDGSPSDPTPDGGAQCPVPVQPTPAPVPIPQPGVGVRKQRRRELVVRPGVDAVPGELDGYGPVPASVIARLLARDKVSVPIAAADIGDLDADWGDYRPGSRLDRYVRQRDRTCTFPGCTRRAALCDVDHIKPWPDGPTSANNLHCLCRRHHRLKTIGIWKVKREADGGLNWTAPTGHRYRAPPTAA